MMQKWRQFIEEDEEPVEDIDWQCKGCGSWLPATMIRCGCSIEAQL